jgi:hypothetical protein
MRATRPAYTILRLINDHKNMFNKIPKVAAEQLSLLLCVREVPDSNRGVVT